MYLLNFKWWVSSFWYSRYCADTYIARSSYSVGKLRNYDHVCKTHYRCDTIASLELEYSNFLFSALLMSDLPHTHNSFKDWKRGSCYVVHSGLCFTHWYTEWSAYKGGKTLVAHSATYYSLIHQNGVFGSMSTMINHIYTISLKYTPIYVWYSILLSYIIAIFNLPLASMKVPTYTNILRLYHNFLKRSNKPRWAPPAPTTHPVLDAEPPSNRRYERYRENPVCEIHAQRDPSIGWQSGSCIWLIRED